MSDNVVPNPFRYLQRNAENNPSGVFVETIDQKMLNANALELVTKIAFELRGLGLQAGDVVALDLPEVLKLLFTEAVFHEAAVSTVLPRGYEVDGSVPVAWMFSNATPAPVVPGARVIEVDAAFLKRIEQNPASARPREYPSLQSMAWLAFSSGTTGQPNAISITLSTMEFHAANAVDTWLSGDPALMFLPTSVAMGFYGFYVSVKDGRPFWAVENGDPAGIAVLAQRSTATSLKASPAQLAGFVDALEARGVMIPHVQTVYVVGSVVPPPLAVRLRAVTSGCEIYNVYGSTETGPAFARYEDSDDPFDAGQPFPHSQTQVVDEDDNELPAGQVGRLRIHHPQMVYEYIGNPDATRQAFSGKWFYPGDLGMIRPDGGLTLAGRVSEVINAGGVKIDPAQLDLFAGDHPLVSDAASFLYEAASGAHQVGMVLVTEDAVDVQTLIRNMAEKFGSAAPKLVARIDVVPRNAMGKPRRLALAEMHRGH